MKRLPPWRKKAPPGSGGVKLTEEQKAKARARALKAGRRYPNLVDNMWAARQGNAGPDSNSGGPGGG